jgi:CRISPR-associated protein Cas2
MSRRSSEHGNGPTCYIVAYDISDPKRLRKVHKVMKGFGVPLQYSVFSCDLTATELVRCETALRDVMDTKTDQVLFINIGPARGRARLAIFALGRAYAQPERCAIVA